jgi:uncharacterized membrane protein
LPKTVACPRDGECKEQPVSTIEKSIDVQVPVHAAHNQWTQFESFPEFMEEIRQLTDTRTHWKTKIAGATREFDAEIVDQQLRARRPR